MRSPERAFSGSTPTYGGGGGYGASRLASSASGSKVAGVYGSPSKRHSNGDTGSSLKKQMNRAAGLKMEDVDTADVDKLRKAAAEAVKMEARLKEVEVERAKELRELQVMMSSLQRKEEELSKFVSSVQKRRQETDPYEKVRARPSARPRPSSEPFASLGARDISPPLFFASLLLPVYCAVPTLSRAMLEPLDGLEPSSTASSDS